MSNYVNLLRNNPGFARLWLAQVVSLFGDWLSLIVLSALVSRYSEGMAWKGLAVSGFLLAHFVPPLVFSPWAGVLVDRFNRKRLLIFSDVSRAVVVLLFLLADTPDRLWLIYLLTVVQFALSAVFEPGRSAIMPSLLPESELVTANTLSSVTWSVMLAVGAIAGGVIASLFGTAAAFIVDAASFGLSALLISQIAYRDDRLPAKAESTPSDRSFSEGLRYIARHPATGAALLIKMGLSLGSIDAVLIIYGTSLFVMGENGTISMSILWSAFGIGAIVGPMLTNPMNDGSVRVMRRLVIAGYILVTIGWFLFGSAPTLVVAALALVVRAMGGSVNWTYSSVIIQKSVPDKFLGRMFALDMAGFQLATAASIFATGHVIDLIGDENVRQVVTGLGYISIIPLILWGLAVLWLERRENAPALAGD
jgi:MFS family permease